MPRTTTRAAQRKNRKPNEIHRKIALRKKSRKVDEPVSFVVNWR